jgi:uncharacterized protein YeaC (DUF1315 family)
MTKPYSVLHILLSVLFLTLLVFSCFVWIESSSPTKTNDELVHVIESVRTYGLNEKKSILREVGSTSSWLTEEIQLLKAALESGKDPGGMALTESQKQEIVYVLGRAGWHAQGGTSILLKTFIEAERDSLKKQALLSLMRIKSTPESVKEVLTPVCAESAILSSHACAVLSNLGMSLDSSESMKVKELKSQTQEDFNGLKKRGFHIRKESEEIRDVLYRISILGEVFSDHIDEIKGLFPPSGDEELKATALEVMRDITPGDDDETISFISGLMQFGSTKKVREEALLTLIGIGSEQSLKLARTYGHKYIAGEPRPDPVDPHPFRSWVLEGSVSNRK